MSPTPQDEAAALRALRLEIELSGPHAAVAVVIIDHLQTALDLIERLTAPMAELQRMGQAFEKPTREQIARVIDPEGFKTAQEYWAVASEWQKSDKKSASALAPYYRARGDEFVGTALAKADAILALFRGSES